MAIKIKFTNSNKNINNHPTMRTVPIFTDYTGKDLVDEIRRLRVAIYTTHYDRPTECISIKALMEENEVYKQDIEEYKDRIKELENKNQTLSNDIQTLSNDIIEFLYNLVDIFFEDGDPKDPSNKKIDTVTSMNYSLFMKLFVEELKSVKDKHKRFFKDYLRFYLTERSIVKIVKPTNKK